MRWKRQAWLKWGIRLQYSLIFCVKKTQKMAHITRMNKNNTINLYKNVFPSVVLAEFQSIIQ
jgi:hypothetical protein